MIAKSVCYAHAVKVTFEEVGVEEPALDLDDDDASTVVGGNRARIDNEWETEKVVFTNLSSVTSHSGSNTHRL